MRQFPFEELVQDLKNETDKKTNASLQDWLNYIELEKIHRTLVMQGNSIPHFKTQTIKS
jgi:hypothetical protein